MKREPSISEQQAREIVERMGRRESRSEKSMDDFYKNIGLDSGQLAQPGKTVTKKEETATADEPSGETPEDIAVPQKRVSSKQRRLSLDEYRTAYLQVPKITDRKPVFVSGEVRDRLDGIVRRLGGRGMSASGMVENIVRLHLETYREDIEQLLGKGSFYDLPDRLVDTADENGGPDNITALLLGVEPLEVRHG